METINQQKIEEQFSLLELSASKPQWNNPKYLFDLSSKFENENIALAYRLIQRAHNLNPKGPVILKRMNEYRDKLSNLDETGIADLSSTATKPFSDKLKEKLSDNVAYKFFNTLKPYTLFVLLPTLIFAFYQFVWASDRYESIGQVLIKQPDNVSSMTTEMALLSGIGVSSGDNDTKLVEAYIFSADMLKYLDKELQLREHFSSYSIDFFSRLHDWNSNEDFLAYYLNHIEIVIDQDSSILDIKAQSYTSEFAHRLSSKIIERAEWFINEIGHKLAEEQLLFISNEHKKWAESLANAQKNLLAYQQKHSLLDPTAEGAALQSIAYGLEGQIASKRTELIAAEQIMGETAPQVLTIKNELSALQEQLLIERKRLTKEEGVEQSVSEIIAKFSDLKIQFELAMQAYTGSLASLEKTRVEAYRQIKYLVIVQLPTLPDDNAYPTVFYNILLFMVVLSLVFGIVRLILAIVFELS